MHNFFDRGTCYLNTNLPVIANMSFHDHTLLHSLKNFTKEVKAVPLNNPKKNTPTNNHCCCLL